MTDHQQADLPPQYGVGPFSIREAALGGIWLLALIVSFFPVYGRMGQGSSVWTSGIDWILTIGVPTAAVFLLILRRLSPDGIRRVGSLGIDQFASVAFSVSAVVWLAIIWNSFLALAANGVFLATWVVWVEFLLMLAGVILTVFAPLIPPFAQDFAGRPEVPAHRNARPVRAIAPRPAPAPRPAATPAEDAAAAAPRAAAADEPRPAHDVDDTAETRRDALSGAAPSDTALAEPAAPASTPDTADAESAGAPAPPATAATAELATAEWEPAAARDTYEPVAEPSAPARRQAFWALAPDERDVVDEVGIPIFRIGPTAWALVIEDRGDTFVVRHDDGRIGYLHDVEGVTRG